jgi:hypothetical protein
MNVPVIAAILFVPFAGKVYLFVQYAEGVKEI